MDPFTIGLIALAVVLFFFMFRSQRRRRHEAETLQTQMAPGVEVMTSQGIFGTIISINDDTNEAVIESTPGTRLRVHRQTLSRVVEPAAPEGDENADELEESGAPPERASLDEPEFGERADEPKPKRAPRKKPTE